jgi:acetate kinase
MRLLIVNAGSSSTKCSILDSQDAVVTRRDLPAPDDPSVPDAVSELFERFSPEASVHRIVHGGAGFRQAVLVNAAVEADIAALSDLAPLHNPPGLVLLDHVRALAPQLPAVVCFDTSFFAELPAEAATYALPGEWRDRFTLRRYGFHGLSHAWAVHRAAELVDYSVSELRVVSAHLGAGASLAAIEAGRPVDTTTGFTPLDGLVMATRSGSVDPGAVTFLLRHGGMTASQLDEALEHRSGLLALAGTANLEEVIERVHHGDGAAGLAWGVYLHRLRGGVAAMAAAMGGIDLLVFTGGAGEASPVLREAACAGLGFLGLEVDDKRNAEGTGDRLITPARLPAIAVVGACEDLEMAHQARKILAG